MKTFVTSSNHIFLFFMTFLIG